jgi:hypothetical protein
MAPGLLCDDLSALHNEATTKRLKSAHSSIPKIADIDCASYSQEEELVADIIQSLKLSGGCIVRGMYHQTTLDAIEHEIRPYIQSIPKANTQREDFVPSSTKMVTGLLSKSRTYALSVVGNKTWHRVCEHFLSSRLSNSWVNTPFPL